MFTIQCPTHGSTVLLPLGRIRSLRNTADGIRLDVECWCGTTVQVRTGRARPPAHTGPQSPGYGSNL